MIKYELSNKCIFDPVELVDDDELSTMLNVGMKMIDMAKSLKDCACLTANQIGIPKRLNIIADQNSPHGYNIFVNADVVSSANTNTGSIDGLSINLEPDRHTIFVDSASFPRNKLRLEVCQQVTVSGFSLITNDLEEFEAEGTLAYYWQAILHLFNGMKKEDIVSRDVMTLRGKSRIKPNARCQECGRKFKKCRCEVNETVLY